MSNTAAAAAAESGQLAEIVRMRYSKCETSSTHPEPAKLHVFLDHHRPPICPLLAFLPRVLSFFRPKPHKRLAKPQSLSSFVGVRYRYQRDSKPSAPCVCASDGTTASRDGLLSRLPSELADYTVQASSPAPRLQRRSAATLRPCRSVYLHNVPARFGWSGRGDNPFSVSTLRLANPQAPWLVVAVS